MYRNNTFLDVDTINMKGMCDKMKDIDNTMKVTNETDNEQLIKNKELRNLIEFKLNKNDISREDLDSIDEIIIDGQDIVGQYNKVYFEEIDLFKNLEKIAIKNLRISAENIKKIKSVKQIEFKNCEVENVNQLYTVKHLTLNHSEIDDLKEIEQLLNLEDLELVYMQINDFNFLQKLTKLKTLKIKNIEDFSLSKINFSLPIKYLSIENIEQLDLSVLSKFEDLEILSVDRQDAEKWENELKKLKDNGLQILLNDIYEY